MCAVGYSCEFETDCKKNLYAIEWVSSNDQKEWLHNCEVIMRAVWKNETLLQKKKKNTEEQPNDIITYTLQ